MNKIIILLIAIVVAVMFIGDVVKSASLTIIKHKQMLEQALENEDRRE